MLNFEDADSVPSQARQNKTKLPLNPDPTHSTVMGSG